MENKRFKKMPSEIMGEMIDLSGLSDEEALEKMKEVMAENNGAAIKLEASSEKKKQQKTPAYVEQFLSHSRKQR